MVSKGEHCHHANTDDIKNQLELGNMWTYSPYFNVLIIIVLLNEETHTARIQTLTTITSFAEYSYFDLVFWTSDNAGLNVYKSMIPTTLAAAISLNQVPLKIGGYPTLNIFFSQNVTILRSSLRQVHQLFKRSQNMSDFSNTHMKTLQHIFLFVLPENIDVSILREYLLTSSSTNLQLNSKCYALALKNNTSGTVLNFNEIAHLYEFYFLKNILKLQLLVTGNWEKILGFILTVRSMKLQRGNFEGIDVIALGTCGEGFSEECEWNNKTKEFVGGAAVHIYRDLRMALNFSEIAMTSEDFVCPGQWNQQFIIKNETSFKNETSAAWLLAKEKVDVVISQNVHTEQLATFFTLPHPTFSFGVVAFFHQPRHTLTSIFVMPFRPDVWVGFFGFWLINLIIVGSFVVTERFYLDNIPPFSRTDYCLAFLGIASDVAFSTVACLCQRGLSALSLLFKIRHVFTAVLMSSVLWNSAYQAGYLSSLATHAQPIKSFRDLLTAQYQLLVDYNSISIPSHVKKLLQASNMSMSRLKFAQASEVISLISESQSAYLEYFDTIYRTLESTPFLRAKNFDEYFCNTISTVFVDQRPLTSGFVLPKHSPFREHFNIKIIQLKEFGLNFKYLKTYERSIQPRCLPIRNYWSDLDLNDMEFAFQILLYAGVLLSSCILICETITSRCIFRQDQLNQVSKENLQLENAEEAT